MVRSPEMDVPEGWKVDRLEFSGNFKLIGRFEHESGAIVTVNPIKTYHDQPGFCNAHKVVQIDSSGSREEIAAGVEYVEDAKRAAAEAMKSME